VQSQSSRFVIIARFLRNLNLAGCPFSAIELQTVAQLGLCYKIRNRREVWTRAIRRLGEVQNEMRKRGELAKKGGDRKTDQSHEGVTLAQAGVNNRGSQPPCPSLDLTSLAILLLSHRHVVNNKELTSAVLTRHSRHKDRIEKRDLRVMCFLAAVRTF
jgi:hypothetical protein